jgi:hypothetical protein
MPGVNLRIRARERTLDVTPAHALWRVRAPRNVDFLFYIEVQSRLMFDIMVE